MTFFRRVAIGALVCLGLSGCFDFGHSTNSGLKSQVTLGIEDIAFIKLARDHSINSFLDLVFHQHYRFEIKPVIQRPQAGRVDLAKEPVVSGRFRLRGMLLANEEESKQVFLSAFDMPVEVHFGQIVADVKFSYTFRELPLVASRNRLVLELTDLETDGASVVVEAPLLTGIETGKLFLKTESRAFLDLAVDALRLESSKKAEAEAVISAEKILPENPEWTPLEYFKRTYGLEPMPDEFLQAVQLRERDLQSLLQFETKESDQALLRKLCELFYPKPEAEMARNFTNNPDATQIGRCRKSPLDYLHYAATKHIHNITSAPAVSWSDGPNLRVSASYAREAILAKHHIRDGEKEFSRHQEGLDAIVKRTWDVRNLFKKPIPFVGSFLPEVGYQYQNGWQRGTESYTAVQIDDVFAEANQFQIIEFHNLTISDLAVAFRATTQRCFIVGKKQWTSGGYIYCEDDIVEEQLEEHWYYVFEWFQDQSNPLRDTRVLAERPWTKLIRGRHRYNVFREMVIKKENKFVFIQDEPVAETSGYLRRTFFPPNLFNGHIFDDNFPGRFY